MKKFLYSNNLLNRHLCSGMMTFLFLIFLSFSGKAQSNCGVTYNTTGSSITISNLNAEHVILKLFNPNWSINYQCVDDCSSPTSINGLSAGTYHLSVNLYNANWQPICDFTQDVIITGGSGCTDNDNDGFCQADDCDDNDASIPATVGTACNDGDSNTNNDVIQADGCTCAGTPTTGGCSPSYTTTSNSITLSGLNSPHVILKVFNPNWSINYQCVDDCSNPTTVSGLSPGTYHLAVNLYDANWSPICDLVEDFVITGGSSNLPDLDLADFQVSSSGSAGSVVNFTVDLINDGSANVTGNYTIRAYLSTNTSVGNGDTEVGQIVTGNTPIGRIQDVPGAITIPSGFAAGDYFLILSADDDDVIVESTNGNNFIRRAFTVEEDVTPGDECGFFKTYQLEETNTGYGLTSVDVNETTNGFLLSGFGRGPFNATDSRFVELEIDANGNQTSLIDERGDRTTSSESTLNSTLDGNNLIFTNDDPNGNNIWTTTVTPNLEAGATILGLSANNLQEVYDGFLAVVTVVIRNVAGQQVFTLYSAKLDLDGNLVQENLLSPSPLTDFFFLSDEFSSFDGYVFSSRLDGSLAFLKFSQTGAFLWKSNFAGDLPSNRFVQAEISDDEQFVYAYNTNNRQAFLTKFRTSDGNLEYSLRIDDVFSANGIFAFSFGTGFLLTSDGGIIVAQNFEEPGGGDTEEGFEYGKIDANGNLVWERSLSEPNIGLRPLIETADGGFLFASSENIDFEIDVMKTTSMGDLTPTCGGSGPIGGVDLPCDLSYTLENGTITISGNGLDAGHVIIKLFSPTWQTVFQCTDNCGDPLVIDGLGDGIYHLSVNLYNNNWQPTCQTTEDIPSGSALRSDFENNELVLDQLRGIVLDRVFPIPASDKINIEISAKEPAAINAQLFDAQGRIVALKTIDLSEGNNRFKWDIDQLPSGMYQILFESSNRHTPIRFVKQRL